MRTSGFARSAAAFGVVAFAFVFALGAPGRRAVAANPGEAPGVLDTYVFPADDPTRVVIAFDVRPRTPRGTAVPYFDPNVLYTILIDNVGDGREHLALQFKAIGTGPLQRIAVYGPAVPNGPSTTATLAPFLGSAAYNTTATLDKGISLFGGPRRDPFFFDRAQFERIASHQASCFRDAATAENAYRNANVLALVVEVPKTLIAPRKLGRINLWTIASVATAGTNGPYVQVSRAGRPGVRDLFENSVDRDASERAAPYDDPKVAAAARSFAAAPPVAGSRSAEIADAIARLFATDELEADVEAPGQAGYLAIETATPTPQPAASVKHVPPAYRPFGGRGLSSPAMARTLDAVFGDLVPRALLAPEDGRETPCLTSDNISPPPNPGASSFPYLDAPI